MRKNRVRAGVRVCMHALAAALQGSFDLREIYEKDGDRKEPHEREGGDDGDDAAAFRTWNNERAAGEDLPGALANPPRPPSRFTRPSLSPALGSGSAGGLRTCTFASAVLLRCR